MIFYKNKVLVKRTEGLLQYTYHIEFKVKAINLSLLFDYFYSNYLYETSSKNNTNIFVLWYYMDNSIR